MAGRLRAGACACAGGEAAWAALPAMPACVVLVAVGLLCGASVALEPLSVGLAIGAASALTGFLSSPRFYCRFVECCPADKDGPNATALHLALEKRLFGQHLASEVVLKAVSGFVQNPEPKKPLALSLHGWAGTGKNLLSQILAENLHPRGLRSAFVHLFLATLHFPHQHHVKLYKLELTEGAHPHSPQVGFEPGSLQVCNPALRDHSAIQA